jgi:hypothetical protein
MVKVGFEPRTFISDPRIFRILYSMLLVRSYNYNALTTTPLDQFECHNQFEIIYEYSIDEN